MDSKVVSIRVAQAVGITSTAYLAGNIFTLSFDVIPRILESPAPLLLRQWAKMYHDGKTRNPPIAALAASAFFYLAYKLPSTAPKVAFNQYITAGVLSVGIVPYTLAFVRATNSKLTKKADETKLLKETDTVVETGIGEETAHQLVDWWGVLNLGRGVLLLTASALGAWTSLK